MLKMMMTLGLNRSDDDGNITLLQAGSEQFCHLVSFVAGTSPTASTSQLERQPTRRRTSSCLNWTGRFHIAAADNNGADGYRNHDNEDNDDAVHDDDNHSNCFVDDY
jgi:hypothetical protein